MGTMLGWFREGGPIMLVIALVGLVGIGILVERLYVIVFRSKNNGRVFIERIIQLVRGGKLDEAIKQCAGSSAALPDIGLLILRSRSRDEGDLRHVATAASLSVVPKLTRRLQYLPTLAAVAILLGVLGSVHGFREALLRAGMRRRPRRPAVGRLCRSAHADHVRARRRRHFDARPRLSRKSGRVDHREIREFSARLINALIDRPDVRLGHR